MFWPPVGGICWSLEVALVFLHNAGCLSELYFSEAVLGGKLALCLRFWL